MHYDAAIGSLSVMFIHGVAWGGGARIEIGRRGVNSRFDCGIMLGA